MSRLTHPSEKLDPWPNKRPSSIQFRLHRPTETIYIETGGGSPILHMPLSELVKMADRFRDHQENW